MMGRDPALLLAGMLLLGACAGQPPEGAPGSEPLPEATKQLMEASCAAAVAEHVHAPVSAVLAVWSGATPDDRGLVTVGDKVTGQQRVHFCEVSGEGQVYAIRHNL